MLPPDPNSPLRRFERSMVIDYEKWRVRIPEALGRRREEKATRHLAHLH